MRQSHAPVPGRYSTMNRFIRKLENLADLSAILISLINSRFPGKARYGKLNRFSGKGAFDKYSREKFEFLLNMLRENENNVSHPSK
jgi:hypothetical protein